MTAGHAYKINDPKSAPERIAWLRGAVIVRPTSVVAHNALGNALSDKGDKDGAEAEYREAIRLDSKYAHPHNNLGNALRDRGDLDGAIAEYHKAIQLNPKYTVAHNNLGVALHRKGDFDGAMAAFNITIDLDPNYAWPHNNLGLALHCKGNPDGAMAAYREAIQLAPKFARPHNNIGWLLQQKGKLDEAMAKFKEAIDLDPKYTIAQDNLSETERMLTLLPRLPGVLAGRTEPKTPDEMYAFAHLCAQPFQKQYAVAVRLYEKAFTADAKLADDLKAGHRNNAARAAALAAAGEGQEADRLTADERSALRAKALGWLRADLALRKPQATSTAPARSKIAVELWQWLSDTDLAGTRPGAKRDGWSKEEVAAWDAIWSDVRATLAEAIRPAPASVPPDK